jgi:hypothetical protein
MGRVSFSPQSGPQANGPTCRGRATVGFGTEQGGGTQIEAPAEAGKIFSVAVPRGPLYLEWVRIEIEESGTIGGWVAGPPSRCRTETCQVRRRIPVQPQDGTVYIGALVCFPESSGGIFSSQDDREKALDELRQLTGEAPPLRLPSEG